MKEPINLFGRSPTLYPNLTPNQILLQHRMMARRISENGKKLKNPINAKTGKPLKPITIKRYESQLKSARRELRISCKIIKQMRRYSLLEKHYLEYPFLSYIVNAAQKGDETAIHHKTLDNLTRFIELIENQDRYFHDDLFKMVGFVLQFKHPELTENLVFYITQIYVRLLRDIMKKLENRGNQKVVNLQEWLQS